MHWPFLYLLVKILYQVIKWYLFVSHWFFSVCVTLLFILSIFWVYSCHIHAYFIAFSLIFPVSWAFSGHLHALFVACSLNIPLHWVFPSHLHALFIALPFFITVHRVFPSQLQALSVALSLIIPIQCVFPSYLHPLFVALSLIIPVQCVFPSHLLAFFIPFFLNIPVRCVFFLFLLHSRSVSLYVRSFLAICSFTLLLCCSYSLNSASDLARLFHSVLYCCLISLTDLSLHISLAAPCTLRLSLYFFLALSAKSFCDCKYLSTIACASEGTFGESTAAQFLLDDSPPFTFDKHDVPSRLLFDICTSVLFGMFDFSTHFFVLLTSLSFVALSSLLRTLSSLCRCLTLFFLTFGMTCQLIDFMYSCLLINDSFVRNFNRFRSGLNFINSLKKVGHAGLSHGCHVICEAARWLAASPRLIIFFYQNIAIRHNSCSYGFKFRSYVEINCSDFFFLTNITQFFSSVDEGPVLWTPML